MAAMSRLPEQRLLNVLTTRISCYMTDQHTEIQMSCQLALSAVGARCWITTAALTVCLQSFFTPVLRQHDFSACPVVSQSGNATLSYSISAVGDFVPDSATVTAKCSDYNSKSLDNGTAFISTDVTASCDGATHSWTTNLSAFACVPIRAVTAPYFALISHKACVPFQLAQRSLKPATQH